MSNFKIVNYTCSASASASSHIDAEIGLSTSMVATNTKGKVKVGNIVAVLNTKNNVVQLAKVVAKEFYAQPWAVDYKQVFNVEFIAKDVLVSDDDKKALYKTANGSHTQWPTEDAMNVFVKTVITNMSA